MLHPMAFNKSGKMRLSLFSNDAQARSRLRHEASLVQGFLATTHDRHHFARNPEESRKISQKSRLR